MFPGCHCCRWSRRLTLGILHPETRPSCWWTLSFSTMGSEQGLSLHFWLAMDKQNKGLREAFSVTYVPEMLLAQLFLLLVCSLRFRVLIRLRLNQKYRTWTNEHKRKFYGFFAFWNIGLNNTWNFSSMISFRNPRSDESSFGSITKLYWHFFWCRLSLFEK